MTINFKNTPVHVETFGEGKPLILLHGFLEDSHIWTELLPLFTTRRQVICIDLFGHGQTPKLGYIHKMETMAEAVSAVMEQLNIESAQLIGHSMGGYVTMAFLEKFPEKAEGILLLNSTPTADSEKRQKERDQVIAIVKKNKDAFVQMAITNLFAEENRDTFAKKIKDHIDRTKKMTSESIVATLKGLKTREDRTAILKSFPRQKVIVTGKKDSLIGFEDIQKTAKETDAELIAFSGGHMSYIENKAGLEKVLAEFIQD